ncbi:hypothetical protein [Sinomonas albida]|uniref:hypothetical protein n=1 Tax=Sinomonas albida TaxID=369942 RepID=UPI0010A8CC2A|nr:hypothetical protein [Sinomonas albida]
MMSEQGDFESLRVALLAMIERGDERIEYCASLLAPVTHERVRAFNASGTLEAPEGRFNSVDFPYELSVALRKLRAASYRDGKGTWFSARIVATPNGGATAEYNYDDEPDFGPEGVDPVAYVNDAKNFPRDEKHQPEWLKQRLAEGQDRISGQG